MEKNEILSDVTEEEFAAIKASAEKEGKSIEEYAKAQHTEETIQHFINYSYKELYEMLIYKGNAVNPPKLELPNGRAASEDYVTKEIPGEIWRPISDEIKKKIWYPVSSTIIESTHIEGSNFGRVKMNDEILKQESDKSKKLDSWIQVKIPNIGTVNVWRVIAAAWCHRREGANIVHHLTNNGYDNRPSNLMWVTQAEHNKIHFYR